MTVTISTDHRGARNNGTLALLDAGGSGAPGYASCYGGTRPADGAAPGSSVLINALFAFPAGAVQGDGSILLAVGPEVLAIADGVVTWARVYNGLGVRLFDCDVSIPAGAGDLKLAVSGGSSTQVWAGGAVQLASGTMG